MSERGGDEGPVAENGEDEERGQADEGPVKGLVRRHWHGRADSFEAESHHGIHTDAQRERWLSVLRERGGAPPQRVLDVGCGTGVVTRLLADLGHDVTGIDFAPAMLEAASRRARRGNRAARDGRAIDFCAGDAEQLGLRDDAVDLLTARHLLWTLPNPATALREWRRVVRPGGRVLLVEGHWNHDEPRDEYEAVHDDLPLYDGRPSGALVDRLEAAGFRGIEREPLQDPVLWGREPRHDYYVLVGDVPRRDR